MSALYVTTAAGLLKDFVDELTGEDLQTFLTAKCTEQRRNPPRRSEAWTWNASLPFLAQELKDAGLGNITMFIEMSMPPWEEQADVVLAGPNAKTAKPAYAIIELKQWTDGKVNRTERSGSNSPRGQ